MTPGQRLDRALTLVNQAGGPLGVMVIKRTIRRSLVREVITDLEEAVAELKAVESEPS